jgi:hypothetical protein
MLLRHALILAFAATFLSATGTAEAKKRSPKDQALYEKAFKDCNSPKWPNGANIVINYAGGWYRCEEISGRR